MLFVAFVFVTWVCFSEQHVGSSNPLAGRGTTTRLPALANFEVMRMMRMRMTTCLPVLTRLPCWLRGDDDKSHCPAWWHPIQLLAAAWNCSKHLTLDCLETKRQQLRFNPWNYQTTFSNSIRISLTARVTLCMGTRSNKIKQDSTSRDVCAYKKAKN